MLKFCRPSEPQIHSGTGSKPFKSSQAREYFNTSHLKEDFKARWVKGSAITVAAQAARFIIQTGSTIVMARLLSPEDYGLVAMGTAITGFIMIFKDLGLSTATVQKADTTHGQISTLFWLNVGFSTVLTLTVAASSPAIAWFYDEPRVVTIVLALSTTFFITGLGVQHQALLRRQMQFTAIAVRDVLSMLAGAVFGISLAVSGARYWSLVAMQIATAVASTMAFWLACQWRPSLPTRGSGARSMVHFGMSVSGFQIVNYFSRNADNILLGRFYGSTVLGIYSRAYALFMLPISQVRGPLSAVALPVLSRLQNAPDEAANCYYRYVSILAFITMPFAGFLFICSDNIIHLLLGDQWMGVSPIFKILAVAGFIQAVETTSGLMMLSCGLGTRYLVYGTVRSVFLVTSFVAGLPWGAIGVAAAFTISSYIILLPSLWYCFKGTSVTLPAYLRALARPSIAALVAAVLTGRSRMCLLDDAPEFMVIILSLLTTLASYILVWMILPQGVKTLSDFFSMGASLVTRRSRGSREQTRDESEMK